LVTELYIYGINTHA